MTAKSKSRKPVARVPDEVTAHIKPIKEDEVSSEQFISTSMLGEINRKLDKKPYFTSNSNPAGAQRNSVISTSTHIY